MNSIRTRRRWQFSLQAIFVATVVALCAIWIGISITRILTPRPDWVYNQQLHQVIATANRIDVRYGHEQEVANTSIAKLMFSIDAKDEIADVRRQLRFERRQSFGGCSCVGLLHIQWYRDNHLVADTSLIHGQSIRWNAVPGDMSLTDRSAKRIQQWLTRHGLSPTFVTDPPWPN
ncbi:MAG: hypothetical protein KDA87_24800 [Planctomycetales bacterium]|nr:hypothetical protein [Planctomycetales bacterium]